MYSKALLKQYIDERLIHKGWNHRKLAEKLDIPHSNLTRAIKSESHHFTLPQFTMITDLLELTPDQVMHILTGKKKKEAVAQLVHSAAERLVSTFIGVNKKVNSGA